MYDILSELRILQSAAGYYIGRLYYDTEYNYWGPYCRVSGYYSSPETPSIIHKLHYIIMGELMDSPDLEEDEWEKTRAYLRMSAAKKPAAETVAHLLKETT